MRLDVYLTAAELTPGTLNDCVVGVIDVLRASTTIAAAIDHGARAVIPFDDPDVLIARAKTFERAAVLLAGERKMLPISGFDLGNSPLEMRPDVVGGKTLLFSTTNGTHALLQCVGAREVVMASYVNCSAVTTLFKTALRNDGNVALVCAGHDRRFSLEDAACAGRFVRTITRKVSGITLNDAAHACSLIDRKYGDDLHAVFADSVHGQALAAAGFTGDLDACADIDAHPVLPAFIDRQIVRFGNERNH